MRASLMIERNGVEGGRAAQPIDRAAGQRTEAVGGGAGPRGERRGGLAVVGPRLVERIGRHGVAHALRRRGREEEAVAAADHRLVGDAPGDAQPRRHLAVIGMQQAARQPDVARQHIAVGLNARVEQRQRGLRRNHEAALGAGRGNVVRIEIRQDVVGLGERRDDLVAQSEVQRQPRAHLEIVLHEVAVLPVVDLHGRPKAGDELRAVRRQPQLEAGKRVRAGAAVTDQPARIAAIVGEAVGGGVAHQVGAELQGVLALGPIQRVAERDQALIERAVGVAAAVGEVGEAGAEVDGGMAVGIERLRPDHGSVSRDIRVVEADARQELAQGLVAAAEGILDIEAAARLVHDPAAEQVRVRGRNRVVQPGVLRQSQAFVRARPRRWWRNPGWTRYRPGTSGSSR